MFSPLMKSEYWKRNSPAAISVRKKDISGCGRLCLTRLSCVISQGRNVGPFLPAASPRRLSNFEQTRLLCSSNVPRSALMLSWWNENLTRLAKHLPGVSADYDRILAHGPDHLKFRIDCKSAASKL
jgi:hypothetical protein